MSTPQGGLQTPPGTANSPNFDPLAKPYRWLEYLTFGPILQQTRTRFLPNLTHARHALVLGDGDGRFTAALLRANPEIRIHAVDLSPKMLQSLTQAAHPHQNRLTTETADLRSWTPAPGSAYDLIATHFFLDCLTTEEIANLATRISRHTTSTCLWVLSDFAVPPTHFGHWIAKPLIAILYRAFRLLTGLNRLPSNTGLSTTLPDHQSALESANWATQTSYPRLRGLLISQLWSITEQTHELRLRR